MAAQPADSCELSIGDIGLAFIPDGHIKMPPVPMFEHGTQDLFDANSHLLDDDGYLVMSLGSLLVETDGKLLLIDLAWGPSTIDIESLTNGNRRGRIVGGALLDNLAGRGIAPADIDMVLFTHLHADHVGWLITESPRGPVLTFPKAEYLLADAEWAFWSAPENAGRAGGPRKEHLNALAGRLNPLKEGCPPAPGVDVLPTPGHTPGHTSFVISSRTERAVVLGDVMHCALEISHPELALLNDVDPSLGIMSRDRIRSELERPGTLAVGSHFPETVFGRVLTGSDPRRLQSLPPRS